MKKFIYFDLEERGSVCRLGRFMLYKVRKQFRYRFISPIDIVTNTGQQVKSTRCLAICPYDTRMYVHIQFHKRKEGKGATQKHKYVFGDSCPKNNFF